MKKPLNRVSVVALLSLVGCAGSDERTEQHVAALGGSEVTTSSATFSTGQSISVSWTSLPGNQHDWVALAPAGSDPSIVLQWAYTNGVTDGSYVFASQPAGSYVARAFVDDGTDLLDESPMFDVTAQGTVGTAQPSYTITQAITATWSGLPGNQHDWIAIAPAGSPSTTVLAYVYTNGQAAGMHSFDGLSSAGSYVVRAFADDSYEQLGESAFTVDGGAFGAISTDAATYSFDGNVVVTWSGLPGNQNDWIAIAPQGSPATTVTRWVYTAGAAAGSASIEPPSVGGTYVVRAFIDNSYAQLGESAPFNVGLEVTSTQSAYTTAEPVVIDWANMPTNSFDWIAIAPEGSPLTTVTTWIYTGGQASGQHAFDPLAAGTYVARAFLDNTYTLLDETAAFTVGAIGGASVTTNASYAVGEDITVTWSGLPGNAQDWIAIAPEGSADTTVVVWVYTAGQAAGSATFSGGLGAAGSYVARAFQNNTYAKLDESAAFIVQ